MVQLDDGKPSPQEQQDLVIAWLEQKERLLSEKVLVHQSHLMAYALMHQLYYPAPTRPLPRIFLPGSRFKASCSTDGYSIIPYVEGQNVYSCLGQR